ncbi:MAG: c-type cytochrome [Betaproteobacteria bacterium]|nr:c-type cytochrome [Betaproteobacteria bacterium]
MNRSRIAAISVAGAVALASVAAAGAGLSDKSAMDLMAKAGCTACHSVDKKGVGPAYKEVAKKRKGEKDAVAVLEKRVRSGGAGVYGPIPMPPNPKEKISDKDLHEMVEWVLRR